MNGNVTGKGAAKSFVQKKPLRSKKMSESQTKAGNQRKFENLKI